MAQQYPFTVSAADADIWFTRVGLAPDKIKLLRQMTYRRGPGVSFCDTEAAQHFLDAKEFRLLLRALASTGTLQVRLKIRPGERVDKMAAYWAQGENAGTVKALLHSLAQGRHEVDFDVSELLPALPRTWLYKYPVPSADGRELGGDCFWTSLNFFRAEPEPRFFDPAFRATEFRERYQPVAKPENLGDIIVFLNEQGAPHHACTYVAADIVFTKNGALSRHPWVLMRLDEVRAIYHGSSSGRELVFRPRAT
jgi:hypothetical protein